MFAVIVAILGQRDGRIVPIGEVNRPDWMVWRNFSLGGPNQLQFAIGKRRLYIVQNHSYLPMRRS
jgi:hypothetical protein